MAARIFALLLVGIVVAAALAFSVADLQRSEVERRDREQRVVDRVADLAAVLSATPRSFRPLSLEPGPDAPRLDASSAPTGSVDEDLTARLSARLGAGARPLASLPVTQGCRGSPPDPPRGDPRPVGHDPAPSPLASSAPPAPSPPAPPPPDASGSPPPPPPPPTCRHVAVTLESGERVALLVPSGPALPPPGLPHALNLAFLGVIGAAAAILALVTAQIASGPLSRLSRAAHALGDDLDRAPLRVEGPLEVREAAQAFNAMQTRLKQHVEERTYMLAAITHDLQTPLTRHRLRLEKIADAELRGQLMADYGAMQALIRDGLDLARASSGGEGLAPLDVSSLLHSLSDDAVDAGFDVAVTTECAAIVITRPQALKRCLSNLIDNAIKYAGSAELRARSGGRGVVIEVLDRGPGIDLERLDTMMQPFVRGESSRSRETGGAGLGLTIAAMLAEKGGACLCICNRRNGGLRAEVKFQPGV